MNMQAAIRLTTVLALVAGGAPLSNEARHYAREPRRIALLMGVSDYRYFPPSGDLRAVTSDLRGPRNDLPRMKLALERWGFSGNENVRVLADAQASRAGILDAFHWVAETATDPGDVVVIYWSGHGSSAPDEDHDEAALDPSDKLDEGLVPWDAQDIHNPHQLILDDDIKKFLDSLKTTNVTVIVDACYSGTITRGFGPAPRGPLEPLEKGSGGSGLDRSPREGNHVLITAASPYQRSYEEQFGPDSSEFFGVLTYYLTEALNSADPNARYDELYRKVTRNVQTKPPERVDQVPQLEGVRNARLFHLHGDVARLAYVTVSPRGERILMNAGAVHGLRRGAEYEVFGPDEMEFRKAPLGRIVVDTVNTLDSYATIQNGGPFPAGSRAILTRVPGGALALERLDVYVDSSAKSLAEKLNGYPWVRIVSAPSAPAVLTREGGVLRVVHRGLEIIPEDSARVVRKTILRGGSQKVISGFPLSNDLCEPLARAFAAEALTQIDNPSAPDLLGVDVRLVKSGSPVSDRDPSVPDTVFVNDLMELYAKVSAPKLSVVYVTVAIEGLTGKAEMEYPKRDVANQPVELNKWFSLRGGLRAREPVGIDVLKAVASTRQYDFASVIATFPSCSAQRQPDFDEEPNPINGWTATERRVVVMRRPGRR